jgi:hypothetical protein
MSLKIPYKFQDLNIQKNMRTNLFVKVNHSVLLSSLVHLYHSYGKIQEFIKATSHNIIKIPYENRKIRVAMISLKAKNYILNFQTKKWFARKIILSYGNLSTNKLLIHLKTRIFDTTPS